MRLGAASALLCAALWHGVALATADASAAARAGDAVAADPGAATDAVAAAADQADPAAGQDPDLDLIPKAPKPSSTSVAPPPANTGSRMYLENAFSVSSLRNDLLVPAPAPRPYDWQERLFFDVRKEYHVADRLNFTLSDRLNFRGENDLDFPTHENLINDLREIYLGWQATDRTYLDAGRINLKSGVALGYNPTDFFRPRAVVEPLSADPTVLREDRLGTLMFRGQQLWEHGSFIAAFAPKVANPSAIYTNLNLPSVNPTFDRTNAHARFLLQSSVNVTSDFSPEFLLYREGNKTRFGTNLAESVGQKVVTYLEWSGGRRTSLIDEALRYGRETGTLPVDTPSVLPESSHETFQNELSLGLSYTTESRVTFNFEYHLNQPAFTHADWSNWFASGNGRSPASPLQRQLWYLRNYAADQQDPISRHSAFLRADWVDAFIPKLELTAFVNDDLYDGSGLLQVNADYYLSDTWTVGALAMTNFGRRRSDFGSLPQAANFLVKVARYLQ
jgi:hypothetical protein